MFQDSGNVNSGLDSALGKVNLLRDGISGVYNLIRKEIDPKKIMQDADEINRSASKMARESLGRGREISNMLTTTFAKARENTLEFGFGLQENLALFSAINNQLQTTRLLTSRQLTDMNALAMSAGLTAEEMAGFVKNFDMLGKGTDDAIGAIARLETEAKSYGLNVGQFMRTVGENIKLVASYNFKDGVDGLSKMVAQAQSLRIDMGNTVKFAEDLMDPTKAIETAAGFQMIGGAVGRLGDPFQLLHMAQTDMAGLQDELVNMSAAAVTFNESTGEFDIPVTEMYRMREAAKLAGMSYQDFAEMAMNSAKKTKKLEFLDGLANIPEEQKEMVANLGELQGGQLKISIGDDLVDVANLTESQLEELGKFQKDLNKSDKELRVEAVQTATESLGVLEKIEAKIAQTVARPETDIITSGSFQRTSREITNRVNESIETFDNKIKDYPFAEKIENIFNKITPDIPQEDIDRFVNKTFEIAEAMSNAIKKFDISDLSVSGVLNIDSNGQINLFNRRGDRDFTGSGVSNVQSPNDRDFTGNGVSNVQSPNDRNFTGNVPQPPQTNPALPNSVNSYQDSTNTSNETTNGMNDANLNVNGTVTLNLEGTNQNFTQVDFNRLAQNNPEFIAMLKNALFNLDNRIDSSIMA